jgi:hypothetical protein
VEALSLGQVMPALTHCWWWGWQRIENNRKVLPFGRRVEMFRTLNLRHGFPREQMLWLAVRGYVLYSLFFFRRSAACLPAESPGCCGSGAFGLTCYLHMHHMTVSVLGSACHGYPGEILLLFLLYNKSHKVMFLILFLHAIEMDLSLNASIAY